MTDILDKYNKGNNFWDIAPSFRIMEVFDTLYKKDTSKNKEYSSNIMWAIVFCLRRESPMYNLPDKWELAAKDIILDEKFDWDKYDHVVVAFKHTNMTQAERSLLAWEELMAKRDKYLKTQEYYFDYIFEGKTIKGTAEQLDRAFSVTPKMYSDFDKIRKSIMEDDIKRGKANKPKSLSDAGDV